MIGLDNQQERTVGLDFLAGLITGEGCFCLAVQRIKARKGALRITPIFNMFMSDRETVALAVDALKAHGLSVYIQERPKAARDQLGIHASGMLRVKRYCETFVPLLTGQKRRAAELTYEFIESRLAAETGEPYTEREKQIVRELRTVNGNTNGKKTPL